MSHDRLKRLTEMTEPRELTEGYSKDEMEVISMIANDDLGAAYGGSSSNGSSIKEPKHLKALAGLVQKKLIYVTANSMSWTKAWDHALAQIDAQNRK